MRELNKLNQIILEKFASKQAYAVIKGHYIPIVMGNITDESVFDVDKRKYYIQTYEFTMLGFLIDEDEFEVAPAITRVLTSVEFDPNNTKRRKKITEESKSFQTDILFVIGNSTLTQKINYTVDINIGDVINIENFDVFINGDYYGSDLKLLQINTNDVLRIDVVKKDDSKESSIQLLDLLL